MGRGAFTQRQHADQRGMSADVREVDTAANTVWQIDTNYLPGFPHSEVRELTRLSNGNTLINNYAPDGEKGRRPRRLIEVTPDKKVVWVLRDYQTAWRSDLLPNCWTIQGCQKSAELQR